MLSCKIVTRPTWTPLIGTYLPPLTLEHLSDAEESLQRFKGLDTMILGDLNLDLDDAWISRIQRVADLLMEYGLIDLVHHFR